MNVNFISVLTIVYLSSLSNGQLLNDPVVTLNEPQSKIRGRVLQSSPSNNYYAFQDIPYAMPPVGEYRFAEPKPHPGWQGILNTTSNSRICIQERGGTEDCLVLNVYTPATNSSAKLPVLLWIPGGAYQHGDDGFATYNPFRFIEQNIVVVCINYRLGALGFLTTEDDIIPGNLALKDQLLAIKWVNKNIAAFGGDPDKVTLSGESAGSISVSFHVLSQKSTGMYRAAIMQSGTALLHGSYSDHARNFSFQLGKLLDKNFTSNDSRELLQVLRKATAQDIFKQSYNIKKINGDIGVPPDILFSVVVEDKNYTNAFLTEPMHYSLMNGHFEKIPMLIGFNSEECLFFATSLDEVREGAAHFDEDIANLVHAKWNIPVQDRAAVGAKLKELFTDRPFLLNLPAYVSYSSQTAFINPIIRKAELVSKYVPTYLYELSYNGSLHSPSIIPGLDGFAHAEELLYEWSAHELSGYDEIFAKRLIKMWTNFVKELNPTPAADASLGLPIWPQVKSNKLVYLNVDKNLTINSNPRHYLEVRQIFDEYMKPPYIVY